MMARWKLPNVDAEQVVVDQLQVESIIAHAKQFKQAKPEARASCDDH